MDWSETPEEAAFRARVRATIAERLPPVYSDAEARLRRRTVRVWREDYFSDDPARRAAAVAWRDTLSELGWTAPGLPRERGGAGMTTVERRILGEELASADAPGLGVASVETFERYASERHQREHIPRILAGTALFAGGYSEPGSGSDLASLSTRAVRDGDDFIVDGQKIWSSGAHEADWMMVLVRTDPDAPKHRGISMLLVDLHSPGVEIVPLPNITYGHSFNETYFDGVRVPADNLLGAENEGWRVAMSGFEAERSTEYNADVSRRRLREPLVFALSEQGRRQAPMGAALRDAVADRAIEIEVGAQFTLRIASLHARGEALGYVPSVAKLHGSHTLQRTTETTMRLLGLYCQLWDPDEPRAPLFAAVPYHFLYYISATIGGGTSEIQRNVIATRGLGLPRG
ncbi:MAG: acyl-CoA dehydrogenase family protein [Chloroflexi bacterium]|nr:acyl-CoA dehydrogenase family protein [Chloroflexota bacterium]